MSTSADTLPAGAVLAAKFRVVRLLGAGGMGAVYEVEHELTKHRRALKMLHADVRRRPGVVERFLREASAAGRIGDPHIVETFDAGSFEGGEPYVVLELLAGETLAELLERERQLGFAAMVEIVAQACEGVAAAHQAGIVHRDLKPENLFLVSRGAGAPFVKILDFGISKFDEAMTGAAALTHEGAALGTPLYMSPEQVHGQRDLDARADVYALGVILYECAAGEPPFLAASLPHLIVLIHEGKTTPLAERRPDLPAPFCDLVARAMAADRDQRVPSARALGEALRGLSASMVALADTDPQAPEPHPLVTPATSVPPPAAILAPSVAPPPLSAAPPAPIQEAARPPQPETKGWIVVGVFAGALAALAIAFALLRTEAPAVTLVGRPGAPGGPSRRSHVDRSRVADLGGRHPGSSVRVAGGAVLAPGRLGAPTGLTPEALARSQRPRCPDRPHQESFPMKIAARSLALLILAGAPASAAAQAAPPPPTAAARAEAHDRFDRATRLINENDNAAALAELQRVYELVPSPIVLYSIGLVDAAMGRPVEAVRAFDQALAAPGALSPEQIARARSTRAAQAERVGTLAVKVNVEGATVEIDNLDAARAPLATPLEVASGTHVVAAIAPGYVPARKAVSVAGRAQAEVAFDLVPMQGRLAHLTVKSHLPAAEVLVDGEIAGVTPLPSSLSLAPGKHRVEIRRAGYLTARQDLVLGDGAAGEIALDPEEDPVLAPSDGTLALEVRETDSVVTLDDKVRGATSTLHLPGGVHHLRLERAGFFPLERDIEVPAGAAVRVPLHLEPTPDTLAAYTESVRARRTWGWIAGAGGLVLAGVSASILAYDAGQRSRAESQYRALTTAYATGQHPCDFPAGDLQAQCGAPINAAADTYDATRGRDAVASVIGGAGVAALVTGVVLLATGDDPHRYEKKPSAERLTGIRVTPSGWRAPGGGGAGLSGSF